MVCQKVTEVAKPFEVFLCTDQVWDEVQNKTGPELWKNPTWGGSSDIRRVCVFPTPSVHCLKHHKKSHSKSIAGYASRLVSKKIIGSKLKFQNESK